MKLTDQKSLSTRRALHRLPPCTHPNSLDYGLQVRSIMPSKSISPHSLDHGLQVHLQIHSMMSSKCISPISLDYGLQVQLMNRVSAPGEPSIDCLQVLFQTCSITASQFARSWPPSAYLHIQLIAASKCISKVAQLRPPSLHDHGLQVHLHTCLITASKCISNLTQSQPSSVSVNSPDYGLQVRSITASKCFSKLARSRPWSVSLSLLDLHF